MKAPQYLLIRFVEDPHEIISLRVFLILLLGFLEILLLEHVLTQIDLVDFGSLENDYKCQLLSICLQSWEVRSGVSSLVDFNSLIR